MTVIQTCRRMMTVKPRTPAPTMSAATTMSAMIFGAGPDPTPSLVKTVEVANTASAVSAVSQPTVSTQEITAGSRFPRTPNIARLSTMVGADPRLPASEMTPHNRKDTATPTIATIVACQNEIPNPRTNDP